MNLKKNLVIKFHCIYSILKIFICCIPAWEKSCSWDIGQNSLSQPDCRISKLTISPEQIDATVSFLACWYGQSGCWIRKLNLPMELTYFLHAGTIWKVLGVGMVKNGCGQSSNGTLKLTVSEEWTDGINWFFACWYRFTKIKSWSKIFWVGIVENRYGQPGQRTLSWLSLVYWFFKCWYKFRKAKSWFNNFWVALVNDGSALLVHETLKSAVL